MRDLTRVYGTGRGWLLGRLRPSAAPAPAVRGASLVLRSGECLGLVGESGSGKSTLAMMAACLDQPTAGEVLYRGKVVNAPRVRVRVRVPRARGVQIIFQDPHSSLNPMRTVGSVLTEILRVHHLADRSQIDTRAAELLEQVGLPDELLGVRPRRLSGGQRQRVAIARALAFEPTVIIADEIVSALDASVQAQILNLLADLRERLSLTIMFITHDFAVVRQLCDRVAVMLAGEIVESGSTDAVLGAPAHDYTRRLLASVPRLGTVTNPGIAAGAR